MYLQHKTTGVQVKYVEQYVPIFGDIGVKYVRLINMRTGEKESYRADKYRQYFDIIADEQLDFYSRQWLNSASI